VFRSFSWSFLNSVIPLFISLVGNITLARFLLPEDYGVFALATIFTSAAISLADSGVGDYVISKKNPTFEDYSTFALLSLCLSIVFYLAIVVFTEHLAALFELQILKSILPLACIAIILRSLTITPISFYTKNLDFKFLTICNSTASFLGYSSAIYMVTRGAGVWSLVTQPLVTASVLCVLLVPMFWRRVRALPTISSLREMIEFSRNIFISFLCNLFGNHAYTAGIGLGFSTADLGFYSQANRFKNVFIGSMATIFSRPALSILASTEERYLEKKFVLILSGYSLIHTFVVFYLLFNAQQFFTVVLGDQWSQAGEVFKLVLISMVFHPIVVLNSNNLKVLFRTDIYRNLTIFRILTSLTALLFTFSLGLTSILYGQILACYVSVLVDVVVCSKYAPVTMKKQLRIFCILSSTSFISVGIGSGLSESEGVGAMLLLQNLLASSIVLALIALLLSRFSSVKSYFLGWS